MTTGKLPQEQSENVGMLSEIEKVDTRLRNLVFIGDEWLLTMLLLVAMLAAVDLTKHAFM